MSDGNVQLRRESLRRQVDLLTVVRERMDAEHEDDYEAWAIALTPLTDRILHELAKLESGNEYQPYPHPMASQWWYVSAESEQ